MKLLYALVIFANAFLLFQVQPLIAKMIVPWFGGSAAVWTACLLFFQVFLLAGYLYAHWLVERFQPKVQARIHVALIALSLLALPIIPKSTWKPSGFEDPTLRILMVLAVTVGLPYFLLSSTSPLLQAWYARARPAGEPYRLYSLSNLGSMLALLSYPIMVEPLFAVRHQAIGWAAPLSAFVWTSTSSFPRNTWPRLSTSFCPRGTKPSSPSHASWTLWCATAKIAS